MGTPPLPHRPFMHTALQNKDQPEDTEITRIGLPSLREIALSSSEGGRAQRQIPCVWHQDHKEAERSGSWLPPLGGALALAAWADPLLGGTLQAPSAQGSPEPWRQAMMSSTKGSCTTPDSATAGGLPLKTSPSFSEASSVLEK